MTASLDHLLWAAPDLTGAITKLEKLTGVQAAPGGRHPHLGTHNGLTALGDKVYLELIAPCPEYPSGPRSDQFAALAQPALFTWAACVNDAEQAAQQARAAGLDAIVNNGRRQTLDGAVLQWKTVQLSGHPFGTLVPFLIDWLETEHPSRRAPAGITLQTFHLKSPDSKALINLFDRLDIQAVVDPSEAAGLTALLDTPKGSVELTGP